MIKIASHFFYGYQGQEKSQNDVNWDNFELRTYNHDLGRWSAPDPYGQFHSPYLAMGNNPVNNIDPNGGYMNNNVFYDMRSYWVGIGNAQRSQDYDLMLRHLGPYSQSAMYESYKEKLASLYANVYGGGVTGEDDSGSGHGGKDVQYMNALYELNNEYIGMGLANNSLSSGMSVVSFNTIINNQGLVQDLTSQNGEAQKMAEMAGAIGHTLNFDAQCDAYSNNAFNASSKEQRMTMLAKSRAKAQAEYEAKKKAKVEEAKDKNLYSNRDWHYAVGTTAIDGQRHKTGYASNPNVSQVTTVFGGANSSDPMAGGTTFVTNNLASCTIEKIALMVPDGGAGTTYNISFLDNAGNNIILPITKIYPSQPLDANGNNVMDVFNLNTPAFYNSTGGTILINVNLSNCGGNNYDNCWNVGFYYWNQK